MFKQQIIKIAVAIALVLAVTGASAGVTNWLTTSDGPGPQAIACNEPTGSGGC